MRDACAVVVLLCYAEERETVCVLCGLLSLCLCVRAGASGGGGRGGARGEVERWGWGRGGVCRTHLSCARQKGVRARPPRLSPLPCACAWVRKQPTHTHHGRYPLPALALGDAARAGRGQAGRRREQSGRARPGLGRLARLFVRLQVCGRGECVPLAAGERGGVGEYRALARRGKREADAQGSARARTGPSAGQRERQECGSGTRAQQGTHILASTGYASTVAQAFKPRPGVSSWGGRAWDALGAGP